MTHNAHRGDYWSSSQSWLLGGEYFDDVDIVILMLLFPQLFGIWFWQVQALRNNSYRSLYYGRR